MILLKRIGTLFAASLLLLLAVPAAGAATDPFQVTNIKFEPTTIGYPGSQVPDTAHITYETSVPTFGQVDLVRGNGSIGTGAGDYRNPTDTKFSIRINVADMKLETGVYKVRLRVYDRFRNEKSFDLGNLTVVDETGAKLVQNLKVSNQVIRPNYAKNETLTTVSFDLARKTDLEFQIANSNSNVVYRQAGVYEAGTLKFQWNGRNSEGLLVPDGKYFIRIETKKPGALPDEETNFTSWEDPANWFITVEGVGKWPLTEARMKQIIKAAGISSGELVPGDPVKGKVSVRVELAEKASMIVSIFDKNGETVTNLNQEALYEPGEHNFVWDGKTQGLYGGDPPPDGVYYVNIWIKDQTGAYGRLNVPGGEIKVTRLNPQFATITGATANVRSGAGTGYPIVGQVNRNDIFVIYRSDNNWYSVKLPNGVTGYISGTLVKTVEPGPGSFPTAQLDWLKVSYYHTDGKKVVYLDETQYIMFVLDLATGRKMKFFRGSGYTFKGPMVSGNYLAWGDDSNGTKGIVLYNFASATERRLPVPDNSGFRMAGDYLVYRTAQDVYLYRLSTGETKKIAGYPVGGNISPDITGGGFDTDGEYVVWNVINRGRQVIVYYNIATGELKNLDAPGSYLTVGNGKVMVLRRSDAVIYDLAGGKQIATIYYSGTNHLGVTDTPDLFMNRAVYVNGGVKLVDLDAGKTIDLTGVSGGTERARIAGNKVFYLSNGYLMLQEITLGGSTLPPIKEPEGSKGTVRMPPVNLYSGPGLNYSVIRTLNLGILFDPVELVAGWYKIRLYNGLEGYVQAGSVNIVDGKNSNVTYVVQPGDTLEKVADRFGMPSEAIVKANNLKPSTPLVSGQKIIIPYDGPPGPGEGGPDRTVVHTVQPGESLWKISRKYGTTVDAIAKANNLNPNDHLRVGQRLVIPVSGQTPVPPPGQVPGQPPAGDNRGNRRIYTVVAGDTLWKIAQQFGTTVDAIAMANNLDPNKYLVVGQQILIQGASAPPPAQTLVYTVQPGDSLWKIANKYGTTVDNLAMLNRIDPGKPIYAGQKLRITP